MPTQSFNGDTMTDAPANPPRTGTLDWDERFSAPHYVFGEAPNLFLTRQKALLPKSGKVLCVSDGEGRNGVWLAQQGLDVVSADYSPNAQKKAHALAAKRNVTITTELADMINYDWPDAAYDVVAAIFIQFTGPAGRARMFEGMLRALKPGGLFLLQGYTTRQLAYGTGGPPIIENLYTREILAPLLAPLSRVDIREYDEAIDEGPGHSGMSALIDAVGWK